MITFTDKIKFGKYKSRNITVADLYEDDCTYLKWCIENIDWFEMSAKDNVQSKQDKK
ncbi:hypothetical protein [Acinetobacter sp.]|uniref:exodeoxyribonuclease X C-terminal domain-containing protein n=1 Tax=Acinetobacter sp. TaxID=472 RepID=UPI003D04C1AE